VSVLFLAKSGRQWTSHHLALLSSFFLGGKLVAPLIAAPNGEMRKWEDKGTEHKCLTTGYACNCDAKEITILFCKQIGQSHNTSYAKLGAVLIKN
jgi:hypothetical protein